MTLITYSLEGGGLINDCLIAGGEGVNNWPNVDIVICEQSPLNLKQLLFYLKTLILPESEKKAPGSNHYPNQNHLPTNSDTKHVETNLGLTCFVLK